MSVKVDIEGTELLARQRDLTPEDCDRVAAAARLAIDHGLAVHAQKLLESDALWEVAREFEAELREVAW